MIHLHTAARLASPTRTTVSRIAECFLRCQPINRRSGRDAIILNAMKQTLPNASVCHRRKDRPIVPRRVKPAHSATLSRASGKSPEGSRARRIASRAAVPACRARRSDQQQHLQFCGRSTTADSAHPGQSSDIPHNGKERAERRGWGVASSARQEGVGRRQGQSLFRLPRHRPTAASRISTTLIASGQRPHTCPAHISASHAAGAVAPISHHTQKARHKAGLSVNPMIRSD